MERPTLDPCAGRVRQRQLMMAGMLLLAGIIVLVYQPALNGGFLWDDDRHVPREELRSLPGLSRIWFEVGATQQYYPLLHSWFWLQWHLFGDNTVGYHLTNLLLHALDAFLVWIILRKLRIPGAFLAAAIFAVHPVQVESAAWITEQKNTLSALFYLGAMLVYLRFDQSRGRAPYALSLALFVLGLLSKTITATLPAALLIIFWWRRGKLSWKRDVLPLTPFFVIGVAAGLFTAWVECKMIGAEGANFQFTILERLLLAGQVPWFYLSKLFWPANLIFIYPRWKLDTGTWWQWLFPVATIGVTVLLWKFRNRWRGPLAGWLFFVGTLFPVLGFLNVYPFIFSYVADHFQYLASLGIIVPFAAGLTTVAKRWIDPVQRLGRSNAEAPGSTEMARLAPALAILLVCALGGIARAQANTYSDSIELYRTTLERNPNCWLAANNLGTEWLKAGQPQEAIKCFQNALEIRPNYYSALDNLGAALLSIGQIHAAVPEFQRALEIKPTYERAHHNLGLAYEQLGDLEGALHEFEQTFAQDDAVLRSHFNAANVLVKLSRPQEAVEQYRQAIELEPHFAAAHFNLANTLAAVGKGPQAIDEYRLAIDSEANYRDAHYNLANTLLKNGQPAEAVDHYLTVLRLDPKYAAADANLAIAYGKLGRATDAVTAAQQGIEIAQANGDTALATNIANWLADFRKEKPRNN